MEMDKDGDVRGALRAAAAKFREYERLHMAKGSIDGDAKARANCEMAEMCETALSTPIVPTRQPEGEKA